MSEGGDSFNTWLKDKLESLDVDSDVYLDYITGVLEEEGNEKELKETLVEILSGVLEENVEGITGEIIKKFVSSKEDENKEINATENIYNPDDKIKSFITQQQERATAVKESTTSLKLVDTEMKKLVLNQYRNRSNSQDSDASEDEEKDSPSEFHNVNTEAVIKKEQEKREKAKKASDEKKARDKLNREKEKQKKEERSEKEKKRTQKGERKR